jgi:hypothetical protein
VHIGLALSAGNAKKRRRALPALPLSALTICFALLSAGAVPCRADFISCYQTQPGAVNPKDGNPVNASATFAADSTTLTITLTNLKADPISVSQNISGLFFTFTNGETTGTLVSSAADFIKISKQHSVTANGAGSTGWDLLTDFSGGLKLNLLGSDAVPAHTIIGPPGMDGLYDSANGSLAGNRPHNPFIDQTATFILNVPISQETRIDEVIFSFGTAPGQDASGTQPVPEPASLLLIGSGLSWLVLRNRNRRL